MKMTNMSLGSGAFWTSLKTVENCKLVLNLSVLSKITEKLADMQISSQNMETVFLHLKSNFLLVISDRNAVVLILLVLSPAFDSVDYVILCCRLKRLVGFHCESLAWFHSCLTALL